MSDPEPARLLDDVLAVARRAGERILGVREAGFAVRHKCDGSPVTDADLAAHETVLEGLARVGPGYPVLSEEGEVPPLATRARWRRHWLVDPLDGTHGFVRGADEFTVNVALIEEGEPVLGCVLAPAPGRCWLAAAGTGARHLGPDGTATDVRVCPLRPGRPVRVAASRKRRNPFTQAFIEHLGEVEIVAVGSTLKSCALVDGSADVYPGFGATSEWDTAAAQCVVEEAGGRMIDLAGRRLRYNACESTDNPRFLAFADSTRDWLAAVPEEAREEATREPE